jgi:hypothetical protein
MASRHSLTIQLADPSLGDLSPGHAAVVINTPDGQTYAGLGPAHHGLPYSPPSFVPQTVPAGVLPPDASNPLNYSTVFGHNSYKTFTIPVSESAAAKALAEVRRMEASGDYYNLFNSKYCTLTVNRILDAAGLGSDLLYSVPSRSIQYLSDIEKTLSLNPNAKFTVDGNNNRIPIPEALRGLQQDYAYVGGGYDTPSERVRRATAYGPDDAAPDQKNPQTDKAGVDSSPSGNPLTPGDASEAGVLPPGGGSVDDQSKASVFDKGAAPIRYLSSKVVPSSAFGIEEWPSYPQVGVGTGDKSQRSVFDRGAPAVPFLPPDELRSRDLRDPIGNSRAALPDTEAGQRGLAGRIAALAGIDPANPDPRALSPQAGGIYDDALPQPWLFRALTGGLR